MKKRKESIVAWTQKKWALRQSGIGVYHTMLWAQREKTEVNVKVRITIEEV